MIPDLKEKYKDRKLVMVVSWPELFLQNKGIDRLLHLGNTPHFYDDYIHNRDTMFLDMKSYDQSEPHVHKSQHLIHN